MTSVRAVFFLEELAMGWLFGFFGGWLLVVEWKGEEREKAERGGMRRLIGGGKKKKKGFLT